MAESILIMNAAALQRALARMAHEIAESNERCADVVLVGIQRGGVFLSARLSRILADIWKQPLRIGTLDVSMHRDDLHQNAAPQIQPTVIPFDITDKTVVLVDDVLFHGRTVRAALDALNDFGRARRIQQAVLIDRGHRELPIQPDFVAKTASTTPQERIVVNLKEEGGEDKVTLERP